MQAANPPETLPAPNVPEKAEYSPDIPEDSNLSIINDEVKSSDDKTDNGVATDLTTLENKTKTQEDSYPTAQNDHDNVEKSKPPVDGNIAGPQGAVEGIETKFTASKSSLVWDRYMKMAEEEDKDVLEDWEGAIDVTLVFAALFSAISTGFVLESSKGLQPDSAVMTVQAIRELTNVVQAGFQTIGSPSPEVIAPPASDSFKPSTTSVWVNCLWFFSLSLSISVSLFAMLAKRWCYKSRSKRSGTSYHRALRRQEARDTFQTWKLELLIDQLPTVMHVALMTFFIGLVLYLSEIHPVTTIVTAIPVGLTILSYGALTVVPVWNPTFPLVTPFTQILQAGISWILLVGRKPQIHPPRLNGPTSVITAIVESLRAPNVTTEGIRQWGRAAAIRSPPDSEWVLAGCSKPVGKTASYQPPKEFNSDSDDRRSQYIFPALMWILQNSNEKIINEVLDYIESFPEVVLDSFASSQALYKATLAVTTQFQRLKYDPVEYHDPDAIARLEVKCSRFMYLTSRPWLHPTSTANGDPTRGIHHFWSTSQKEIEDQISNIRERPFETTTCIPWLEQQAIKIALGCLPQKGGFQLCRELHMWVSSNHAVATGYEEEIYSTFSWILLNLAIDAADEHKTFWPSLTPTPKPVGPTPNEVGSGPLQVAKCDSALTLRYFRRCDGRNAASQWLKIVGLSGALIVPTYCSGDEIQPDVDSNRTFYEGLIELLRGALTPASRFMIVGQGNRYLGKMPVYHGSDVRLYEFDSLHYCFDALERACQYDRFAQFHGELNELKNLIPESRRGRTVPSVPEPEGRVELVHGTDTNV
ncbi:unnamed protein product [Rhizoctonia solani]|uniref:DUF6535 domain-containing protein n=1 Tax=Rhizoctonia solani TaxID=456999 RepID=A0A8H2Y2R7_9AGAM|nr:unnamed protein product [Rhizoctonia solani]